jgi:hypothetical protein
MEVEVALPQIEGIAHVGCGILRWKTQSMVIHKLRIPG